MTKQLVCADVTGDCNSIVTGENEEEILDQAVPHAQEAHGLEDSEQLRGQLRDAIRET